MKMPLGNWLAAPASFGTVCPVFRKTFAIEKPVAKAEWFVTALGIYQPYLNGVRVTDAVLLPGWTSYRKRVQIQGFDVTDALQGENTLEVMLGQGWCGGMGWTREFRYCDRPAIISCLEIEYADGFNETIVSDRDWQVAQSGVLFSEIYDGEVFDANVIPSGWQDSEIVRYPKETVFPQEGEWIKEQEKLPVCEMIHTPNGEVVLDFGQNLTGYVLFEVQGPQGHEIAVHHAEVLDADGNFYTANLRSAKQEIRVILNGKPLCYKPFFTFQGFRYIRLTNWPEEVKAENFTAVAVYSEMKRTGEFRCSEPKLNQLYQNILWGQRGNFVDVPTDCPQRDERLGWTGDAEVFIRAAAYNYDVNKFFVKWLHDLKADQFEDGGVPAVIPDVLGVNGSSSAAWGDAAVICPWQLYVSYGNKQILEEQFSSMQKWIDYLRAQGNREELWNTGEHYGDWLGLDAPYGSYKGSTSEALIATAYFAYSTSLFVKAGNVLGKDMSEYERLYARIRAAYLAEFLPEGKLLCRTQTAHVVTLYFDLCDNKAEIAADLAEMLHQNGDKLQTGFVGTPYLLHVLSDHGYTELAYSLLLQEEFPSWLFSVNQGATTIWEHWDGIRPDGSMWSTDMNSFNHYAYGAVADWMYGVMAGIQPCEEKPGYKQIRFEPLTDKRMSNVKASVETQFGTVSSAWWRENGKVVYEFLVPAGASGTAYLDGQSYELRTGKNTFRI